MCATRALSRTHMNSACAPNLSPVLPKIRSPTVNSVTAAPAATTSPANSLPRIGCLGRRTPDMARLRTETATPDLALASRVWTSNRFTVAACTLTRTSSSLGAGCYVECLVRLAVHREVFLLVVDLRVGSDRSDDLEVFRAADPGDVGAEVLGQLHPGGADGPRRAVHEDSLSLLEICRSQALQSQDRSVADGCGLVEAHTIRHVRQRGRFPHAHELRVRSEPPRIDSEYMVADGELPDGRADCCDLSCDLGAEDPLSWP